MGKNQFKTIAERISNSPFVLPIFAITVLLALSSLVFSAYDYYTSYKGVELIPIKIGWPFMKFFYAGLPQGLQIISGFAFLNATGDAPGDKLIRWGSVMVFLVSAVLDNGSDIIHNLIYPVQDMLAAEFWADNTQRTNALWSLAWAFFMSIAIHTFGSEGLFVWGFGLTIYLFPHAAREWLKLQNLRGIPFNPNVPYQAQRNIPKKGPSP
jgi:hypothetical protein